ncbi:MAG: division/cell wall cluster transcriptional repressor MraZ [Lachnospiraceae bacterium]|nr:division/cell wall cluster transcriptional repressor MraZ [Lachnospiraceae bacterium]
MFIGEYNHTMDEKGRFIIPSKFRDELDGEFVVTKGLDGCLFAYGKEDWAELVSKLRALPVSNKDARAFTRYMLAGAAQVEIDKQGRALVPQALREFVQIKKEVVLIGVGNRFELWNKDSWNKANLCAEDGELLAEKMEDLGI